MKEDSPRFPINTVGAGGFVSVFSISDLSIDEPSTDKLLLLFAACHLDAIQHPATGSWADLDMIS